MMSGWDFNSSDVPFCSGKICSNVVNSNETKNKWIRIEHFKGLFISMII